MLRPSLILFICVATAMLGCTSTDPAINGHETTVIEHPNPMPTPTYSTYFSDLEVIGIIQAYLETRIISVRYSTGRSFSASDYSASSTYSYRDVDCRTRALELMEKWEANSNDNGDWTVFAHKKQAENSEEPMWEWRLFPSGVITTIKGPC